MTAEPSEDVSDQMCMPWVCVCGSEWEFAADQRAIERAISDSAKWRVARIEREKTQ